MGILGVCTGCMSVLGMCLVVLEVYVLGVCLRYLLGVVFGYMSVLGKCVWNVWSVYWAYVWCVCTGGVCAHAPVLGWV
jgi:hypothetical protein